MKKLSKKLAAGFLAFAMVLTTALPYLPSIDAFAASKTMAHIVSGAENGNTHFGGSKPEAFVLSPKATFTNESFSSTLKLGSAQSDTRARVVLKYKDDSNWAYIGYDGAGSATDWIYEYNNNGTSSYGSVEGLPAINQNDMFTVNVTYTESAVKVAVRNITAGTSGTGTVTDASFVALKDVAGKVGFGGGSRNESYTDLYFSDVVVGDTTYSDYSDWTIYNDKKGSWDPAAVTDDGTQETARGRKWITVQGGSRNGNGHNYGNASAVAPALLLDQTKTTPVGGTVSLKFRPVTSTNWGIFYTYKDDNNWLYVGYDPTSKWYFQYKVNGTESYPKLSGLPDPVLNETMEISITVSRENLTVIVDGKKVTQSVQALTPISDSINGEGHPGVKTNGSAKVEFSDFKIGTKDCMGDTWGWAATRSGQVTETYTTAVAAVSGKVIAEDGTALKGATVKLGSNTAKTDDAGNYSFDAIETGTYNLAASRTGYQAHTEEVTVSEAAAQNVFNVTLSPKAELDLSQYAKLSSDYMDVYVGKEFPVVARYATKKVDGTPFFRGQEEEINSVSINKTAITPTNVSAEGDDSSRTYTMDLVNTSANIDLTMKVKISVDDNDLTWEVTSIKKKDGCADIATIEIPQLNLLSTDMSEEDAAFDGVSPSTTTTQSGDSHITWDDGFNPSTTGTYMYGFLSNGSLSGGVWSNSEIEDDKRVTMNSGADSMSLTSSVWYYERGDKNGQAASYSYPTSDLPCAKVCIAGDANGDGDIDWNDGALAFRDIMNIAQGAEDIKDLVNYRIVMNFAGMATNPYLETADNIKKVYLATDGLPQAVMLKGYGNEGHDSANSEYADVSEREGGITDFQNLIKIAHQYNTEVGIHINAQEAYPEAKSFNETMLTSPITNGWGWLDQSFTINKLWDLGSQARYKRLVQLYDRINGTSFYSGNWDKGEYVKDSQGILNASMSEIAADAAKRTDNMDFIYLDVWYQNAWETRQIAKEINSLGWRFSTEFGYEGEYDSTWSHWATDAAYGGASLKGWNSEIIRFLRNDQRDTQILNYPKYGGTADNPLLGGYRLYGFEGWGGDQDYNSYITETFTENLPTRFLQHYYVTDWEDYGEDEDCPTGNTEKQITLKNDTGDTVVVTRNTEQRSDSYIERTITLNGKEVLNDVKYLLPWTDENGDQKLYHWNLDGGTSTWELPDGWTNLANVVMYELSDQGRINEKTVAVSNGTVTLDAKAATAYVLVKGESSKTLKVDYGEDNYVVDPGFNGYSGTDSALDAADWSGDIDNAAVTVEKYAKTGDQRLAMNSPEKDVTVSTKITGLTAGKDYVAELYVDNESDAKAVLSVNTGSKEVSNYTMRSFSRNTVASDEKHGTNMQRILVSFTAEGTIADLKLSRAAGEGSTYWDDIRIVQKKLDNYAKDGSFHQDFESVVEGMYPFVHGFTQTGDQVTHLAQKNEPYTQAGWNNRVISDVIDGEWSLKQHASVTGLVYYTIPQNFRFEAGKVYNVEFDYLAGNAAYQMIVGDGNSYSAPTSYLAAATGDEAQHVSMQVIGSGSGQTWIGLYENGSLAGSGSMGQTDFVLDNLTITEDTTAVTATVEKTELYKGETAQIIGQNLDQITFTSSDDSVMTVDAENHKINAVGAGSATLTGTLADGSTLTFDITVKDTVVNDIPRTETPDITSSANTEESTGEPTGSGVASAATDGDSSTYWHSNWSTTGFNVSQSNPAILTVDLGKSTDIGGFKFQQRPSTNNGIVYQYSYRILDENDQVIESGDHLMVPSNLRAGAAWVSTQFDTTAKNARKIQILVEEGQGGFAAISEVVPFTVQKVADAVTLDAENVTLKVGETVTLTPSATPEGAMLKGLVWNSSDEEIATVDENGVVTALKDGTATIKVSNAAGLEATCKVTVKGKAEQPDVDKEAPTAPDKLSKAEVTKDSIQIRWKKSKDNVEVKGYEIFLNGVSIKKVSADTTSVMISNLLAGTEYQITVKAYDAAGNYSEAAALTVKTLAEDKNNSGNKDDNQKPDSGNKNDGQKPSGDQNQNSSADKKPAGVPQVTVVKTGDSGAPIGIFVVLAIVAAGAVVVVVLRMKADQKKNAKKKHRNRPDGTR